MKSLVEIAKEMGFEPNPNLTKEDWTILTDALKTSLLFTDTGLSQEHKQEQERQKRFQDLPFLVYHTNALKNQGGVEGVAAQNVELLKSNNTPEILALPQSIPGDMKTTNYVWHYAQNSGSREETERFTADINMTSRFFPAMLKKLDQFIIKHHSRFKMPNLHMRHRVDTLNVYMKEEITPEIAREFYEIVKPCLKSAHHDNLNGKEIYLGNTPVKGIKIGPVLNGDRPSYDEREQNKNQWLKRDILNPELREVADSYLKNWVGDEPYFDNDQEKEVSRFIPSLGEVSTSVELMNLMYYMVGKEGKNPFQLLGYDNKPYQKHISFEATKSVELQKPSMLQRLLRGSAKQEEKTSFELKKDWTDPMLWSDVKVRTLDGICYGHRININHFSQEERNALKAGLEKYHIRYKERQATTEGENIRPGDWTIRVADPKSVKILRSMIFQWAEGTFARPVFKTNAEYEAEQKMLQDKGNKENSKNTSSQEQIGQNIIRFYDRVG